MALTPDGYTSIEKIKIGDLVWSYNTELNIFEFSSVTNLIHGEGGYSMSSIKLSDDISIEATSNHPFLVDDFGWTQADQVQVDYKLVAYDGLVNIFDINQYPFSGNVYNLSVSGNHNYLVSEEDVVVHNCPGLPFGALGTKFSSKTLWSGKGKDKKQRIDAENPNPGQRDGQIHYQDGKGNKFLYDPQTKSFKGAPRAVNKLLNNPEIDAAIRKAMRMLGES